MASRFLQHFCFTPQIHQSVPPPRDTAASHSAVDSPIHDTPHSVSTSDLWLRMCCSSLPRHASAPPPKSEDANPATSRNATKFVAVLHSRVPLTPPWSFNLLNLQPSSFQCRSLLGSLYQELSALPYLENQKSDEHELPARRQSYCPD